MIISPWILFKIRNISGKSCRENQNTYFMFNNFFPKGVLLWDNAEKYGRARQATLDNIIGRMLFTWWINKAADTHSEYVILTACPRQKSLRERASGLHYTYVASLVELFTVMKGMCVSVYLICSRGFRKSTTMARGVSQIIPAVLIWTSCLAIIPIMPLHEPLPWSVPKDLSRGLWYRDLARRTETHGCVKYKITVLQSVTTYSFVDAYRHFGRTSSYSQLIQHTWQFLYVYKEIWIIPLKITI
jgi:hypothetical protein